MEAEAQQRALLALDNNTASHFTVNLDEVDGWDDGLICGGAATIFTAPLLRANYDAYRHALDAEATGRAGALVTFITHPTMPAGTACWIAEGQPAPEGVAQTDIDATARFEKAQLFPGPTEVQNAKIVYFVEPVIPAPRLFIIGAGHIGKALCEFAARVGFRVTVIDDRPTFANAENLPHASEVRCGNIDEELRTIVFTARDFVVIVTRGHKHDGEALAACVTHDLAYLGLIGSKRKGLLLRDRLREEAIASEAEIARVITPMGLDLGGHTVEEIALSIAAQLVSVRRKGRLHAPPLNYGKRETSTPAVPLP